MCAVDEPELKLSTDLTTTKLEPNIFVKGAVDFTISQY
jgi:hypothetical protein